MQALGAPSHARSEVRAVRSVPSMPHILEAGSEDEAEAAAAASAASSEPPTTSTSASELALACPPRRCHSDTSLAALAAAGGPASNHSPWLAQLKVARPRSRGWGLQSPAPLQHLATAAFCASVLQQARQDEGASGCGASLDLAAAEPELR